MPATRPERFAKALDSGADCIIVDLEDAVSPDSKDGARAQLAQHLPLLTAEQRARTVVRVNAVGTPWHDADIALLRDWAAQRVAVMLPKSEDAGALRHVAAQLGEHAQLVALIESLAGPMRPMRWRATRRSCVSRSGIWISSSTSACARRPTSRSWPLRAMRSWPRRVARSCRRRSTA